MTAYAVLYLGLTACAFALVYMWNEQRDRRLMNMDSRISEVRLKLMSLERLEAQQNMLAVTMTENSKKNTETQEELAKLQEHCAKLRKEQQHIEKEVAKKKPILGFSGPLQVEILGPTEKFIPPRNLGKKGKKNADK